MTLPATVQGCHRRRSSSRRGSSCCCLRSRRATGSLPGLTTLWSSVERRCHIRRSRTRGVLRSSAKRACGPDPCGAAIPIHGGAKAPPHQQLLRSTSAPTPGTASFLSSPLRRHLVWNRSGFASTACCHKSRTGRNGVHSFVADPLTLLRSTLSTGCHALEIPVESQQPNNAGK